MLSTLTAEQFKGMLTGTDAETLADQMVARIQSPGANIDIQSMIDRCPRLNNDSATGSNNNSTYGPGMMNQNGAAYGRGMMGGWGVQQ